MAGAFVSLLLGTAAGCTAMHDARRGLDRLETDLLDPPPIDYRSPSEASPDGDGAADSRRQRPFFAGHYVRIGCGFAGLRVSVRYLNQVSAGKGVRCVRLLRVTRIDRPVFDRFSRFCAVFNSSQLSSLSRDPA